ncbi:N-acetyltransferase family protein [Arhodomonas sp. SL1]|uniref:GNAT family N-acetyltransferase n=1 Tax=Arhodomonas sp. SL1 TaxID=3425691 RepID=UPI003F883970
MTDIPIRDATADDHKQLSALFDDYRVFYRRESDPEAAARYMGERLANGDSRIFVADDDGTLVAFAQLYPTFSSVDLGTMWLFNDLYVDPSVRRQGVGIRMMERVEQLGRETGAAKLFLRTERINTAGQRLYETAGWQLDERFLTYQKYL